MNYCYINKKNQKNAYLDFVKDLRFDNTISFKRFPKDYNGDETVKFACTQHSKVIDFKETVSDYERNKITKSWVDFLSSEQLPLKEVQFCTVTPQKNFDAVCTQATIESLRFKWLKCKDINAISNLSNLKKLFIECGFEIQDLSPLGKLPNLEVLILGSVTKITDYSALGQLKKLHTLIICSYQTRNDIMLIKDDSFIKDMTSLKYLDLQDTKIIHRNFLNETNTVQYEYCCFPLVDFKK